MPLENLEGDSQLTGSTFIGLPSVIGGVFSGSTGYIVTAAQTDTSGVLYVTTTGSLPVAFAGSQPVVVENWPAVHGVSGSANVYTSGPQAVSGTVGADILNWPQFIGVSGSVTVASSGTLPVNVENWPAVHGISGSVNVYTSGPQNVSGTVNIGNTVLTPVPVTVTGQPLGVNVENWPATLGVSASTQLPVYSTGLVGVSGTVGAPVWVTASGSVGVLVQNTISQGVPVTSSFTKPLFNYPTSERITVMSGGLITGNGSVLINTWPAWSEWYLLANLSGAVGGTNPTIQFYVDQVDPIDQVTQVVSRTSGTVMTGKGVSNFQVVDTNSDTFIVGWVVTGTNPFFSGVNISWVGRAAGSAIEGQAPVGTIADDPPVPVAGVDDAGTIQYLHIDAAGNLHVVPNAVASTTTASLSPGWVHYGGSSGIQTAVRGTTYTEQTGSAGRSLKSTSTSDAPNGTGAQQVTITYYDTNGNGPFTEVVTLNGTTAVNTVSTTMRFIEKMVVTKVGSGGSNVGTISLFTATNGNGGTIGSIGVGTVVSALGDNQTLWAHHYVGNLLTGSVVGQTCGTNGNQTAVVYLRVQNLTTGSNPETQLTDVLTVATAADSVVRVYPVGIPVFGPARVTMYVVSNGTNTNFYGSFDWQEHY